MPQQITKSAHFLKDLNARKLIWSINFRWKQSWILGKNAQNGLKKFQETGPNQKIPQAFSTQNRNCITSIMFIMGMSKITNQMYGNI